MKKIKTAGVLVAFIFLLTGCGNQTSLGENGKQISCTRTRNGQDTEISHIINANFKNDKISNASIIYAIKAVSDDAKEEWDSIVEHYNEGLEIEDVYGVNVTINNNAKKYEYKAELNVDMNKISEETLYNLGIDDLLEFNDYDSFKGGVEENGYVCK